MQNQRLTDIYHPKLSKQLRVSIKQAVSNLLAEEAIQ
jgi:hypothetical protein